MELATVALELMKKTAEEIAKEAEKVAKGVTELGKVGSEDTAEQIRLGKLVDSEYEKQMVFGCDEDMFVDEELSSTLEKYNKLNGSLDKNDILESYDVLLEPQISFKGGLSACNWKCLNSSCYPVNIAKGIGTKSPNVPNSKIGHT